ncbi:MAG: class I SAM-dependent methyltransferase [Acidobacteria bacterium]|nr:class I SAM-dependent methyltransferase [Acidobacteriota bacterium]
MSNPAASNADVGTRMREEWNARAREDANYYVAFGRRDQSTEEFFSTAADVLRDLQREIQRGLPSEGRARRFLEIGCGPGRLMKPLAEHGGEIHGIDVSNEMVARARENLSALRHAHVHTGSGSTLDQFATDSFDFVYSYAVFQHIPDRDVVMSYLREAVRVLKPAGIARVQINGLPPTAKAYTTWEGVRISGDEVRAFAREQGIQLLALEGLETQYMWATFRKREAAEPMGRVQVRWITNARSSEPVAPLGGPFASIALRVEGLGESADLNHLDVRIAGVPAVPSYLGRSENDGLRQLNVPVPPGTVPGVAQVTVNGGAGKVRLIPRPIQIPRVVSVSDGVDLLSTTIRSGTVKAVIEETDGAVECWFAGQPLPGVEVFCVDPRAPRHEFNIILPTELTAGEYQLDLRARGRSIARPRITVA